LKKPDELPRPDAMVGTPLLRKEGKLLMYNTINFSSFIRRSTHATGVREVVSFIESPGQIL
jgi:hypothetical protein